MNDQLSSMTLKVSISSFSELYTSIEAIEAIEACFQNCPFCPFDEINLNIESEYIPAKKSQQDSKANWKKEGF